MEQPDRQKATKMALNKVKDKKAGRKEMALAFAQYLSNFNEPSLPEEIPQDVQDYLIQLSEMSTRARSAVARKKYHRDNPITMAHDLEMPMRMALQLLNVGYGLAALNAEKKLLPEDYQLLYKAALDSIPSERKKLMEIMTGFLSTDISGAAAKLGMPFDTVKHSMEDLAALGVVTQYKSKSQGRFFYELLPEYRQLISKFRNIAMTDKILEKPSEEDPVTETQKQDEVFSFN